MWIVAPRPRFKLLLVAAMSSASGCTKAPPPQPVRYAIVEPPSVPAKPPPPELILVPGGTFTMGDRELAPTHVETVATFELERTETTTAAYRECVTAGVCSPAVALGERDPRHPGACDEFKAECNFTRSDREDHPINCVTGAQAEAYCRWRGWRLPTEAEWEFAARGPENRRFPWGDQPWVPERANLCDKSCARYSACGFAPQSNKLSDGYATTAPVGSFPNGNTPLGIADLLGNVMELTASFDPGDTRYEMPPGRVARGSTWSYVDAFSQRANFSDDYAFADMGFRCARDATAQPTGSQTERK